MSIVSKCRMAARSHRRSSCYVSAARWAGAVAVMFTAMTAIAPTRAMARNARQPAQVDPAQVDMWDVIETTGGNVLK